MHDGLHYYLHLLSDLTHLGAAGLDRCSGCICYPADAQKRA